MKTEIGRFNGFSPKVKKFFKELEKNNNKDWFHENKDAYEMEIREPSKALVMAMQERFAVNKLPYIADLKKSMFRINRDIRFSANKDPYKTNLGVYFPYTSSQTFATAVESVGLYFHLDHKESFVAAGIHMPQPPVLKALRMRISEDFDEFVKILNDKKLKKEFPAFYQGDSLVRMPKGFDESDPAAEFLKMKQFTLFCSLDSKDSESSSLINLLEKKGIVISDFLEFLNDAINI